MRGVEAGSEPVGSSEIALREGGFLLFQSFSGELSPFLIEESRVGPPGGPT